MTGGAFEESRFFPLVCGNATRVPVEAFEPVATYTTPEHAARLHAESGAGDPGRTHAARARAARRAAEAARAVEADPAPRAVRRVPDPAVVDEDLDTRRAAEHRLRRLFKAEAWRA